MVLYQHTSSLKITAVNCKTVWEMDVSKSLSKIFDLQIITDADDPQIEWPVLY